MNDLIMLGVSCVVFGVTGVIGIVVIVSITNNRHKLLDDDFNALMILLVLSLTVFVISGSVINSYYNDLSETGFTPKEVSNAKSE